MDGYEELAIAILKQSVADYKNALKKNYKQRISYFERWFLGDWAQLLSGDMGEIIIDLCKEQVRSEADD